jgi:hypothetical protein
VTIYIYSIYIIIYYLSDIYDGGFLSHRGTPSHGTSMTPPPAAVPPAKPVLPGSRKKKKKWDLHPKKQQKGCG